MPNHFTMFKKIYLFLFLSGSFINCFSQNVYDSLLTELNTKYPQESIYLQLDKSFYAPGETIWFKGYVRSDIVPAILSTSLYAELINEKGNIIQRKTMPLLLSGGASNFDLPDSISTSKIFIRAYTSWMLNFDSTLTYVKPVNIIRKQAIIKTTTPPKKYTLTFFPEGGDLVGGIESRIAFNTNDEEGKPFTVTGTIQDEQGKTVTDFSSLHNGMGYFSIVVQPRVRYKAIWKDPSGKQQETILPNAKTNAATLSVNQESGTLQYTIKRPAEASDEMKEFVVIGQMKQQTVYAARINMRTKTTVTAPIPLDSLPDGIMQVTLFSLSEIPVAERVAYINNNNQYFITDLHLIEKNIKAKGKNVLQIDVGGQLKSNLSIAVTDADLDTKAADAENIYSQMLVSADLKGRIYNPAYYFSGDADSLKKQLDLVLMTNGWRRFNWEKLLAGKLPEIKNTPEAYLSIKGNVYGLNPSQLTGTSLTGFLQTTKQADKSLVSVPFNKDGSFAVDDLYFFDTLRLYYQINNDKNKRLTDAASFSFKNNLLNSPPVDKTAFSKLYFSAQPPASIALKSIKQSELYQEMLARQNIKVLETVTVTGKIKSNEEKVNEEYTSGLFNSGNSRIFVTEDDPFAQSSISVLQYLQGKVPGLQISINGFDGTISRRGSPTDLFLNEMRTEVDLIQSTPMSDVAMIKVFDPPFFGSVGGGAGGAVAVYTKKGRSASSNVKGLNIATIQGYSAIKEFYQPNYDDKTIPVAEDYRTTLYWNPFLLMNAQNKRLTIPFFNNDNAKRIRVVIEGINELGQLSREEKIFE
jgi:hypothetical protein